MDIISTGRWPSCALSNFAYHPFSIDGVECSSMEGFLQSLHYKSINKQREICKLYGKEAKAAGYGSRWKEKQELYWNGNVYDRHSERYGNLLNRAYNELYKNPEFREALDSTKGQRLTHAIGSNSETDTILTVNEFCDRLMYLRDNGLLPVIGEKIYIEQTLF